MIRAFSCPDRITIVNSYQFIAGRAEQESDESSLASFGGYRVERSSSPAEVSSARVQRPFTAHCYANYPALAP